MAGSWVLLYIALNLLFFIALSIVIAIVVGRAIILLGAIEKITKCYCTKIILHSGSTNIILKRKSHTKNSSLKFNAYCHMYYIYYNNLGHLCVYYIFIYIIMFYYYLYKFNQYPMNIDCDHYR